MILKRPTTVVNRAAPEGRFVGAATYLPIRRWRDVLSAFRLSNRVESQLKQSEGIVSYSLAVDPLRRHFWTCSLWTEEAAMKAFVADEPHATAVRNFAEWADNGATFAEWETRSGDLVWADAFSHLQEARSRGT